MITEIILIALMVAFSLHLYFLHDNVKKFIKRIRKKLLALLGIALLSSTAVILIPEIPETPDVEIDGEAYIYHYSPTNSFGCRSYREINVTYWKMWLKDMFKWRASGSNNKVMWYNANDYLTVHVDFDETNVSAKVSLILDTTGAPLSLYYRFQLLVNASIKQYINMSSNWELDLTLPANNTEDYVINFNWTDLRTLYQGGKIDIEQKLISRGGEDFYYFNITSVNKIQPDKIFIVDPTFGYTGADEEEYTIENQMDGSFFTNNNGDGYADNITAKVHFNHYSNTDGINISCALYEYGTSNDMWTKIGVTNTNNYPANTSEWTSWETFTFSVPKPQINDSTNYFLCVWGDTHDDGSASVRANNDVSCMVFDSEAYSGGWKANWTGESSYSRQLLIYCMFSSGAPSNNAPTQAGESPTNGSINISLQPDVYVVVTDTDGDIINATWWSNSSGSWVQFGVANTSVSSGTNITQNFANATTKNTEYWWSSNISDGEGGYTNSTYYFTTVLPFTPNTIATGDVIPVNRTKMTVTWTHGTNASHAYIRYLEGGTGPANRAAGTFLYNGTGTSTTMTGLKPGTTYTCSFWAYNDTDNLWSASYVQVADTTDFNLNTTFSGETPTNGTTGIPITQATVNVTIEDPEGDTFNWTIEGNAITSASGNGATNGSKSANTITPLTVNTEYTWYVNVTDIFGNETREIYNFTTRPQYVVATIATGSVPHVNRTKIKVQWTNGANTSHQYIRYKKNAAPTHRADGTFLYNGTGLLTYATGLDPGTLYVFSFWGYNDTDNVFSVSYVPISDTTDFNLNTTFTNENPANGSSGQDFALTWNITIEDPEGDTFNWTIECWNGDASSANGDTNGSKTLAISGLSPLTDYNVSVNATDIFGNWTREWFNFSTKAGNSPPTQSGESPTNGSSNLDPTPSLYVVVTDGNGDTINATWWSNSSGSWVQFGVANTSVTSGTNITQDNGNFSGYATIYYWEVRIEDGEGGYNNETYQFTTRASYTPDAPAGFSATANNRTKITITWTDHANADSTRVEWNPTSDGTWNVGDHTLLYNGSAQTTTHTGLIPSEDYFYKAWSYNITDNLWSSGSTDSATTDYNLNTTYSGITPANGSIENPLTVSYSVTIEDPEGDTFNWTMQSSDGDSDSGTDDTNGSKGFTMSGLSLCTNYTVWVNSTDYYGNITKEWFTFKTWCNNTPTLSNPFPTNGSTGVNITNTHEWNITIEDVEDTFNWTIETVPNIGTNSSNGDTNGSKDVNVSGNLTCGTLYKVFVNVTDGLQWTREWFTFRTETCPGATSYTLGIRNTGIDYFIWLGVNCTASDVADNITGFDEATETIRVWNSSTWDATNGCWIAYYGDASGTDFTVTTFDVIEVTLTDAGTQDIVMTAETGIDYDDTRSIPLIHDNTINKGYNYTGYTSTVASTLKNIATNNISMITGELISVWDNTSYSWHFYVVGFGGSPNQAVSRWQVVETHVMTTKTWTM